MDRFVKTVVPVPGLPDASGSAYEHCIKAGNLVFIAGQTGTRADHTVSVDFAEQVREAFAKIGRAMEAAGSSLANLVTMTVFLTDMRDFPEFKRVRKEVLGDSLAASAGIGVSTLAHPLARVEIQAIGVIPDRS